MRNGRLAARLSLEQCHERQSHMVGGIVHLQKLCYTYFQFPPSLSSSLLSLLIVEPAPVGGAGAPLAPPIGYISKNDELVSSCASTTNTQYSRLTSLAGIAVFLMVLSSILLVVFAFAMAVFFLKRNVFEIKAR